MVDVVSTIGGGSNAGAFGSQPVVVPPTTTAPANSANNVTPTNQAPIKTSNAAANVGSSNRLYADPVSGTIVAQEVSANGQISSQIPQSFVLAYLRDGLDSNGLPKSIDQTL